MLDDIRALIDIDRYPIHDLDAPEGRALVDCCKALLVGEGMFDLDGFVRLSVVAGLAADLGPRFEGEGFLHKRRHNIYFKPEVPGLPDDHPALRECETINRTLCADQVAGSDLLAVYEWPPLARFLAAVMDKPALYPMADPLARVNVMAYRPGEALNWHFDRSEFTTTLLLQAPEAGGVFEYRTDLRTEDDPNYDGVVALLEGRDPLKKQLSPKAGALNVFRGKNTPHRVTPIEGARDRIIAVFSYFEREGVTFSEEERVGFYGRAA